MELLKEKFTRKINNIDSTRMSAETDNFIEKATFDVYCAKMKLSLINNKLNNVISKLREFYNVIVKMYDEYCVILNIDDDVLLCITSSNELFNFSISDKNYSFEYIYEGSSNSYVSKNKNNTAANAILYGPYDKVQKIYNEILKIAEYVKVPAVRWHFTSDSGTQVTEIEVRCEQTIKDEFYPYIKGGIDSYIDNYFKSSESILLLMGPPGTGKSTFLRYMIDKKNLSATLTYDEAILKRDTLFVSHLTSSVSDVLILEDADILLQSRDASANEMMHKLLNVSDGIVKVMNKKIIFTTNLETTNNIDSALLRPGRCFDVLKFKALDYDEALAASNVANIDIKLEEGKYYTIAELFNKHKAKEVKKKIGF